MQRRDLLKAFGATAALALVPHEAAAAWARVAAGLRPAGGLSAAHLALIAELGDTILPRTDTPGATDVGVPAFIDIIVSENYTDSARATFVVGLDALETQLRGSSLAAIEQLQDRRAEPQATYWRLKGLILQGYFSSELVMKDVLKTQIMPGYFDGSAPMRKP